MFLLPVSGWGEGWGDGWQGNLTLQTNVFLSAYPYDTLLYPISGWTPQNCWAPLNQIPRELLDLVNSDPP